MPHSFRHSHGDIVYPSVFPFVLTHIGCFAAIWSGISWEAVAICVALYWVRMFGVVAGYHRYFSHRTFSTSRVFQFILGFWAQTSAQKSLLWWASKHRHHHMHSDTAHDVHSPCNTSFLYSHVGWIFARKHDQADLTKVADLACYPELMWLHRHELLPAVIVAALCFAVAGWSGLVVGFFWSTVMVYHATFCINSLAHVHGSKRFVTGDGSCNNALLAFFTMGEGWHNNHHAYQISVRQGFRWWEVDVAFYILRTLSWIGLVWDLRLPPETVMRNQQRLGVRVINRAAEQLAARFSADRIALAIRSALHGTELSELQRALSNAHDRMSEAWSTLRLPHLPSRCQIKTEASRMFVRTPSLDDIVDRAYQILLTSVIARLQVAGMPSQMRQPFGGQNSLHLASPAQDR